MPVLIVTYELRGRPREDYDSLYISLRQSPQWLHVLECTWLVATRESPNQLFERLRPHIHERDSLLISTVTPPMQGWLPDEAWRWIRKHGYPRERRPPGPAVRRGLRA